MIRIICDYADRKRMNTKLFQSYFMQQEITES